MDGSGITVGVNPASTATPMVIAAIDRLVAPGAQARERAEHMRARMQTPEALCEALGKLELHGLVDAYGG